MRLSIIIPVYNSEKTIEKTINTVNKILASEESVEFILVNDGSKDSSLNVCMEISRVNKNVITIDLLRNFGQHNALLAGMKHISGDYILFMDDDLQTPAKEIPKLLSKIKISDCDVVYGNYEKVRQNPVRRFGSFVNDVMAQMLIRKPKGIHLSSFFVAKRIIIDEISKYNGPYPYIGGLILRATQSIESVPVEHNSRKVGKSNYTFTKLLLLWLNGFTNFSIKPLRVASFMGTIISIISFTASIFLIIRKLIDPSVYLGWTSTIIAISLFGGFQLISIGLLGEYIGRIYLTVNHTPAYIVRNIYGERNDEIA